MVELLKSIIAEICECKRGRVDPALATELELKQSLSRKGGPYDIGAFRAALCEIEKDDDIITCRLLKYNGYRIREDYANDAKAYANGLPSDERTRGARPTPAR